MKSGVAIGGATCVAGMMLLCMLLPCLAAPEAGCDTNVQSNGAAGAAAAALTGASQQGPSPGVDTPYSSVRLRRGPGRNADIPLSGDVVRAGWGVVGGASTFQAKPDLTVLDTWTVPGTFCRFAVVDIHSMIQNIGTVAAGDSFYFDMWFDGDNIGFARIDGLGPGQSMELILEHFAWPGDTLSHAITAMADTDHEIDEELEVNNIHLHYFAADLCTTCTFVTLPFETGWNWFSLNVDDPDMSLDHVLASLDANGVYIKSQTAFAEYVPAWNGWFGTLTSLTCHETYMINMGSPDTLDFCGFPYDVSTPLQLPPGWSWISYLPRGTMSVDDALASLGAGGEYIKNQTVFAEYVPAWNGWFGTLVAMCPCDGYKIRMAVADTLVYPDSVEVTDSQSAGGHVADFVGLSSGRCMVDPHAFETNGCLTAEVRMGGKPCAGPGDRLAAFCRDECRGTAHALVSPDGDRIFYLTVYGREGTAEMLTFRYFEATSGLTYDMHEAVEFRPDIIAGTSMRPLALHVSLESGWDYGKRTGLFSLENHPDPFTRSTDVRFRLGHPGAVTVGIYNVRGEKVATLCDGYLASDTYTLAWDGRTDSGQRASGGVYFCRLAAADALLVEKMVLME